MCEQENRSMQTGYLPSSFPASATQWDAPGLIFDPVGPELVRGGR
jgi:hypothetical protein